MTVKYLSLNEFSEFLDCCQNSAYKLLREKRVPSFRIGNRWRVPLEAAEEYVRGGGVNGEVEKKEEMQAA